MELLCKQYSRVLHSSGARLMLQDGDGALRCRDLALAVGRAGRSRAHQHCSLCVQEGSGPLPGGRWVLARRLRLGTVFAKANHGQVK